MIEVAQRLRRRGRLLAKAATGKGRPGVRFRSSATVFGLPLVDVALGPSLLRGEERGFARGIFAVGDVATGVVALGGVARGLCAVGGVAFGIFSAGGVALGLAAAAGGVALGAFASGGVAIGLRSAGGVAVGVKASGGLPLEGIWQGPLSVI